MKMPNQKQDTEITDLVELIRNGPAGQHQAPEQEVNFDAGYTPPPHRWKIVKTEWIDGKKYIVYS
jgi:hypothetical protein